MQLQRYLAQLQCLLNQQQDDIRAPYPRTACFCAWASLYCLKELLEWSAIGLAKAARGRQRLKEPPSAIYLIASYAFPERVRRRFDLKTGRSS